MFKTSKDYTIYPIELLQVIKEASTTYTFVFSKPEHLHWSEGAHTHLALDAFDEEYGWFQKKDVRHFSIASIEEEPYIYITTRLPKVCTDFKEALKRSTIGDQFYLFKVGSRLQLRREDKPILLISAGVGIASFRPLVKQYTIDKRSITKLIHINIDSSKEFLFKEEFEKYTTQFPEFENYYVYDRDSFYKKIDQVMNSKESLTSGYFYIVGGDDFLINVRHSLRAYGVLDNQIIFDKKEMLS